MRINCLGCGHMVDVGDDYDDYDGQIRCNVCRGIMEVSTSNGKVKSVRIAV